MNLLSDPRHQPVAAVNHPSSEERESDFIRGIQSPLADGREKEQSRHDDRKEKISPSSLTHGSHSTRMWVCVERNVAWSLSHGPPRPAEICRVLCRPRRNRIAPL